MAEHKPNIPEGYLGPQEGFTENGLKTLSHPNPMIEVRQNILEIKFSTAKSYKFTHQLINCRTECEHNDLVFVQTKPNEAIFEIEFPESGWYKLQLFGLPVTDQSKSLPNIFNYVIDCTSALSPVFPYPKQYAQWKDGCYLCKPKHLHKDRLNNIDWAVNVPNAKSVAVVADGEWFHFEKKGDSSEFVAKFNLDNLKDKNAAKITLNANFDADETKYTTLLEYKL